MKNVVFRFNSFGAYFILIKIEVLTGNRGRTLKAFGRGNKKRDYA